MQPVLNQRLKETWIVSFNATAEKYQMSKKEGWKLRTYASIVDRRVVPSVVSPSIGHSRTNGSVSPHEFARRIEFSISWLCSDAGAVLPVNDLYPTCRTNLQIAFHRFHIPARNHPVYLSNDVREMCISTIEKNTFDVSPIYQCVFTLFVNTCIC